MRPKVDYTFNWLYVDDRDTGYFVSGLDPVRPTNVDPNLPTWGTGNAEWQGFLPASQHVARDQPGAGLLRQLEQQAGARLLRRRRPVRLRPGLPLGDAGQPAQGAASRRTAAS